MMKKSIVTILISASAAVLLSSCAKSNSGPEQKLVEKASENIGCEDVQSKIFDALYSYVGEKQSLPDMDLLKSELDAVIESNLSHRQFITNHSDINDYKILFVDYFKTLIQSVVIQKKLTKQELLQALIEFELQDQSSELKINLNSTLQSKLNTLREKTNALRLSCANPGADLGQNTNPETPPVPAELSMQQKLSNGISNVFAVAYQSCRALEIPAIEEETPSVQGIKILDERNPENGGLQRVITSATKVKESHPWVRVASPGTSSCFNVRSNPLIYDYGGKPRWSSSTLDFFTDSGSGTSVLGIDCSGFVTSVLSATGARYSPGVENKPVFVEQQSTKFIDAKASGFKCFDNISITAKESIKPGDIAAIEGHVVIVDSIGADPFGIKRISSQTKCSQVAIPYFDFIIAQSSPSKNGIGINKYRATDYLQENAEMGALFLGMAKAACTASFTLKTVTPKFVDYGIIRHKGTKECLAPKVALAKQSCVSACIK